MPIAPLQNEQKQANLSPSPMASDVKSAPEIKAPVKRVYARPEAGCSFQPKTAL